MNPDNSAVPFLVIRKSGQEVHIYDSNKITSYYKGTKLHRRGGPAIVHSSGYLEWHINGKLIQVMFENGSFLNDTSVIYRGI